MLDLLVDKSGFDVCYDSLILLSARLRKVSKFSLDSSADTSMTGKKERLCYEELIKMANDLAALAEETAQDLEMTKARYVLADEKGGVLWSNDIIQKKPMNKFGKPSIK